MVVEIQQKQAREQSLFDIAVSQFHRAAEAMGLDDNLRRVLSGYRTDAADTLVPYRITRDDDGLLILCDTEDAHYERVSIEEMHAAIRRFMQPERCVISTIRPQ